VFVEDVAVVDDDDAHNNVVGVKLCEVCHQGVV
jgi:hypothetical protein